jgi:ribosome-associated heat shock protein Hsp15
MSDDSPEHVRLDKWLWAARFFKTRGLAAQAIDGGKIQVNAERAKRAKPLHLGDELRIRQGPYQHIVVVRGLSEHRGPASVATQLYEETPESLAARQQMAVQIKSMDSALRAGGERPTKRDRREIERFRRREDV